MFVLFLVMIGLITEQLSDLQKLINQVVLIDYTIIILGRD